VKSREIHLKARPAGVPKLDDFEIVEVDVPDVEAGQVLVQNEFISVDPYMRGRMNESRSYIPAFEIGKVIRGGSVGRVLESQAEGLSAGEYVLSSAGWQEKFVSPGERLRKIDVELAPPQSYLGVMGMPGFTAYYGLLEIGAPKAGETVFVSAAAGAVGSVVCQIARLKDCRVVGSVGSQEKVDWLVDEAGVDAAFNYKETDNLRHTLKELCPNGIDIYFENVGGEHLEAALSRMNSFGRVAFCGTISQYNNAVPQPGPRNLGFITTKRLTLKGFLIGDHNEHRPRFLAEMSEWIREGVIKSPETILDGLEKTPEAFLGLFQGTNLGKMLVRVVPEGQQ
jgi:NADPH-dependent curcumin reductase CurA